MVKLFTLQNSILPIILFWVPDVTVKSIRHCALEDLGEGGGQ
jgi:hypothetical protein